MLRLDERTASLIASLLACAALVGCAPEPPRIPVPEEAIALRAPRDMDGVWLDNQEMTIRMSLTDRYGPVSIAEYRVPQTWTWERLYERFDAALTGQSLQRVAGIPENGRHHRVVVWSRSQQSKRPMVALAEIFPPASGQPAGHKVIVVITPKKE